MKRLLKRLYREWQGDRALGPRIAEVKAELQKQYGPIQLKRQGLHGRDNIYMVMRGRERIGILRLVNPHKKRKPLPVDLPYAAPPDTAKKIEREWSAYATGALNGLTPKPLWRTSDAILCEYLPYKTLLTELDKNPEQAWNILCRASKALQTLHRAGLVHMDSCLQNMLGDQQGKIWFIDFEYMPAAHIPAPAQRVYDHLRLVETAWKFIPEDKRNDYAGWVDVFSGSLDQEMRGVSLAPLMPALPRSMAAPFGSRIREILAP